MKGSPEDRAVQLGQYMIESGDTVRGAAKKFNVSKSTVHKDVTERLKKCNHALYLQVRQVLTFNKSERHIRGGNATREKFRAIAQKKM